MLVAGLQTAIGQTNLGFESWTGTEPNGWTTFNDITTQNGGVQTTIKLTTSPGQGTASAKLITGNCPECPNYHAVGQFGPATPLPNPMGGCKWKLFFMGIFPNGLSCSYRNRECSAEC